MNYIQRIESYVSNTIDALYPIRKGIKEIEFLNVSELTDALNVILENNIVEVNDPEKIARNFVGALPKLKSELNKDIISLYNGDPAAKSHNEIILAYPGFYAVAAYRMAHLLHKANVALIPRIITEHAHTKTGIDIHPGAQIGEGLCIDHGSGVVIGETTHIGNNVKIYQGVTLGALSIADKKVPGKRHPTIEDDVILYAQATILGGDTTIGQGSIIGGNVWITNSVPPNTKIYYNSTNNIVKKNKLSIY